MQKAAYKRFPSFYSNPSLFLLLLFFITHSWIGNDFLNSISLHWFSNKKKCLLKYSMLFTCNSTIHKYLLRFNSNEILVLVHRVADQSDSSKSKTNLFSLWCTFVFVSYFFFAVRCILERFMIVIFIFDDDPLPGRRFIDGEYTRLTLVQTGSSTWPIDAIANLFVFREWIMAHFQLATATTSLYVQKHVWKLQNIR